MKNLVKTGTLSIVAIFAVILVTGLMSIHSCSNEPDIPAPLDIPEEFNEVGKLHNEGLEFIFERIKEQAIESVNNPSVKRLSAEGNDINEFIKQATLDFCKQNKKTQKNIDVCEQTLDNYCTPNRRIKSLSEEISPALQGLLNKIHAVLGEEFEKGDFSKLKMQLDAINQKAAKTLSEIDAMAVYCATSTAYHSYQYWMENNRKWYFALHFPEILEQYNNDELNQLQVKQGKIVKMGWWADLWNSVEDWWGSVTTAVSDWWNSGGEEIVVADVMGAWEGAVAMAPFGPEALIAGAISMGVIYSAEEGFNQCPSCFPF